MPTVLLLVENDATRCERREDVLQIVVYELDAGLREVLRDLLEGEHYRIRVATTFDEIRQIVATGTVELVIADTWGPSFGVLNQREFTQIVKLSQSVPLIMLTGKAWAQDAGELNLGTTVVVQKPTDLNLLLDQIAAAIKRGLADPHLIVARRGQQAARV